MCAAKIVGKVGFAGKTQSGPIWCHVRQISPWDETNTKTCVCSLVWGLFCYSTLGGLLYHHWGARRDLAEAGCPTDTMLPTGVDSSKGAAK